MYARTKHIRILGKKELCTQKQAIPLSQTDATCCGIQDSACFFRPFRSLRAYSSERAADLLHAHEGHLRIHHAACIHAGQHAALRVSVLDVIFLGLVTLKVLEKQILTRLQRHKRDKLKQTS